MEFIALRFLMISSIQDLVINPFAFGMSRYIL